MVVMARMEADEAEGAGEALAALGLRNFMPGAEVESPCFLASLENKTRLGFRVVVWPTVTTLLIVINNICC